MNIRRWLHEHSLKLLAIRDTPEAIAGGVAIGMFFAFAPLFGVKTLGAIFLAWLTRSNIIAALIAVTLHDVVLPLMPAIYLWEYKVGYWLVNQPHRLPPPMSQMRWDHLLSWHTWIDFFFGSVGRQLLLGGCVCSAPIAVISFFVSRSIVTRHQRKKLLHAKPPEELEANAS
jgi:uncharacterized protein (DUF2062 family)